MDTISISLQELRAIHNKLDNLSIAMLAQKTVLNFNEVVAYTGLSESYLYKLTSKGLIPHSKPNGKNIYFDKVTLDKWLLGNKIRTNEELETAAINYVTLKKGGKHVTG